MSMEDYAIIVGLQVYPGLDDPHNGNPSLSGPENDAKAFRDWIVSPTGGNIPDGNNDQTKQVELILSSDHPQPFASVFDARPVVNDVTRAFRRLRKLSDDNVAAGRGLRVGRRLYIFMAGHGIAPETYGDKDEKEVALLMADVERSNVGPAYHVPGAYTATWFCRNACFDEVFLFMDCCRESALVPGLNHFLPAKGNHDQAKRCYVFGTKWSRLSRERPMIEEDGQTRTRGVFTKTLLLGLSGAAAEPDPDPTNPTRGKITVASLKSYLYQNMPELLDPQYRADSELQEPDVMYWPKTHDGRDILIKQAPLQKFPVTIHPPVGAVGVIQVLYNGEDPIESLAVKLPLRDFHINLPRGKYLAAAANHMGPLLKQFDVKGIEGLPGQGGVDVSF